MKLVFDIETNGLLDCNKIWCLAAIDVETGEKYAYGPKDLPEAYKLLKSADQLIGHNIIGFDIPVLERLAGIDLSDKSVLDTLVLSRLFSPTREGGHGLEAWGYKVGCKKIEFDSYDFFSEEMLEYCIRDVEVNKLVFDKLKDEAAGFSKESISLEHDVYKIINNQRINGFLFDTKKASILHATLEEKLNSVIAQVHKHFKPKVTKIKLFKCKNKDGSISKMAEALTGDKRYKLSAEEHEEIKTKGMIIRETSTPFNLGSRKQIGEYLQDFGWKPKKFTPTNQPIVDESTLLEIDDIPEAKMIAEYLLIQKRIAQINSWFKRTDEDGRIRGYVNSNGTITGRMTHRDPNTAQVPSTRAPYGEECRSCWIVPKNFKLCGIDASSLELRMLAHYLNDEGFTNEIINGDIHSANQKLAGLESRSQAKTFIYALVYGAGDSKLGKVVGGNRTHGKKLRDSFLNNLPSFRTLTTKIDRASQRGYLKGIDGRKLFVRSAHAALNTLLQGAGAIVMKKAMVILNDKIKTHSINAKFVANIHDEWQLEVIESEADKLGKLGVESIIEAGKYYELNCPLDGEYKIGNNWADTH